MSVALVLEGLLEHLALLTLLHLVETVTWKSMGRTAIHSGWWCMSIRPTTALTRPITRTLPEKKERATQRRVDVTNAGRYWANAWLFYQNWVETTAGIHAEQFQQTQNIWITFVQCCKNVIQMFWSALLLSLTWPVVIKIRHVGPMWVYGWVSIVDGVPTASLHWVIPRLSSLFLTLC